MVKVFVNFKLVNNDVDDFLLFSTHSNKALALKYINKNKSLNRLYKRDLVKIVEEI